MLHVEALEVFYGEGVHALRGVDFKVFEGEIISIIGAKGAGKSTLVWTLIGLLQPKSGKITFAGMEHNPIPYRNVAAGLALVPERRRIFPDLTVRENLLLGTYYRNGRTGIAEDEEYVFSYFPILKKRLKQYVGTLPCGQQQMVAFARALMSRPRLLLLDEPSLGLSTLITKQVFESIVEISQKGTTILLVEQNALNALRISTRAYILEVGRIVCTGSGEKLLNDPTVQAAYIGGRQYTEVILNTEDGTN